MKVSRLLSAICLIFLISILVFSQDNKEISQCKIRIKVEFLDSGKVGGISLVSNNCNDKTLEREAFELAKNIEFESEVKNGNNIVITKTVEFNFTVYDKKISVVQEKEFQNYEGDILFIAQSYKPLKITLKPRAAYPKSENRTICVRGTVRLRVQFLSNGEIGNIQPVNDLGFGLTEKAIEAARKMKFDPAARNGIPITVVKVVDFDFTIY